MAPKYRFEAADNPGDDAALRRVLRGTAMPGRMHLSLRREPSFFAGAGVGNLETLVVVARKGDPGELVATATVGQRKMFVDGVPRAAGYLSGLRVMPEARNGTVLSRGYRYLAGLEALKDVPFHVTTIMDGNDEGRRLLTSGRAGLPVYDEFGKLNTYLIPLYGRRRTPDWADRVTGADEGTIEAVLEGVNAFNSRFQFAPVYERQELGTDALPGLRAEQVHVYRDGNGVLATLAMWDQSGFKQTVVTGYSGWLRVAWPLTWLGAEVGLGPRLPAPGGSLPYLYGAMASSKGGDVDLFRRMLEAVVARWSRRGYEYLVMGVCEGHPYQTVVERMSAYRLSSTIYVVYWPGRAPAAMPGRLRAPHVEVATL